MRVPKPLAAPALLKGPPAPPAAAPRQGSKVFLKEVDKKGIHRFTVKSAARELKLRAASADDYNSWVVAFRPFVSSFEDDPTESVRGTLNGQPDDFDDDSDSD